LPPHVARASDVPALADNATAVLVVVVLLVIAT